MILEHSVLGLHFTVETEGFGMISLRLLPLVAVVALSMNASAQSFNEQFDTDTASLAETLSAYPNWALTTNPTQGTPADVFVTGGRLILDPDGNDSRFVIVPDFPGNILIKADVGASAVTAAPGAFGTGIAVGPNIFVFHPGLDNANGRGQFLIFGPHGTPSSQFGADMGFVPGPDTLHPMEIRIDAASGTFDIKVVDGNNPSNVFQTTFVNPDYPSYDAAGRRIAVSGGGSQGSALLLFDNVSISAALIQVAIDIKPGSSPNCFNINGHGVVPVAVLGSASFSVSDIDQTSLLLDGLLVRVRGNRGPQCSSSEVNGDSWTDLVCQFEDQPGNWLGGTSVGTLTGALTNGDRFQGTDSICIVP
jgi:hypothetical protein